MRNKILIIYSGFMFLFLPGFVNPPETIKDITAFKQDNLFYLGPVTLYDDLLKASDQRQLNQKFNKNFFAPWDMAESLYGLKETYCTFKKYKENPGFGVNKRKYSQKWLEELEKLADLTNYPKPQSKKKAITVRNTNLRSLPTNKPLFKDFNLPGEGYPFDQLQNSALWVNTPIFISHISKDGSWVLAETRFAWGWIPIDDIAFVDNRFIKRWKTKEYIAVLNDETPVKDKDGKFRFKAHLGAIFPKVPKVSKDENNFEILIGISDANRKAVALIGRLPKESAGIKPLKATRHKVAELANKLLGQTYGWGGMYEDRDCSAMVRDLFVPFGIWLPRNSSEQGKLEGFISLEGLSSEEKEEKIKKKGIPYFTLIYFEGHIMLYIGEYQDRALVMHNFWGIATNDCLKGERKFIVGESAITTLRPGIELPNLDQFKGDWLRRIESMVILSHIEPSRE